MASLPFSTSPQTTPICHTAKNKNRDVAGNVSTDVNLKNIRI